MNIQCSASVSLSGSEVHLASRRYQRSRLNPRIRPSRRRQLVSNYRLNAEAFEQFLCWLDPDPEAAGRKYESIRHQLIMMFRGKRCVFAEDLADATFERVARKLGDLNARFTGDPARYFYGVAKKIYLEYQHETTVVRLRREPLPQSKMNDNDLEERLGQLDEALGKIPSSDRELILGYYTATGSTMITQRRALAKQIGIQPNALRLRVFRIRREIKSYMLQFDAE